MGYTNKTSHYDLPQWIASDKPSWLGDMNAAFLSIDGALEEANANSDVAITTASGFDTRITNIDTAEKQNASDISALTQEVAAAAGTANAALPKSGGTMTGTLTLSRNPVTNLEAATKQYVDNAVATTGGLTQAQADSRYLQLDGGVMSGNLILNGTPTADNQAATKAYVDGKAGVSIATFVPNETPFITPNTSALVMNGILFVTIAGGLSTTLTASAETVLATVSGNPLNLTQNKYYSIGYIGSDSSPMSVLIKYDGSNTSIVSGEGGTVGSGTIIKFTYAGVPYKTE